MFNNNILLCRMILRRDRLHTFLWFIGIVGSVIALASAVQGMYPTAPERLIMAETMKNPAMVAMMGPVYDSGGYTTGALYSNFMLLWIAAIMGIMNIFIVIRHTRQDEEHGRIELIRSLPVGRLSNLSSVLTISLIVNVLFSLTMGLGLTALGIESMDFTGSMLFGAVIGVTGLLFAAVTAVFCQLCTHSSTAYMLSFTFLVASYVVRAVGDLQSELLARLSPLGLILRTQVYVTNQWWPIIVTLLITTAVSLLAFYLCGIRDMGEGIVSSRPGKKDASPCLKSAGGLAWRLLRVPFIIWSSALFALAVSYGSVMGDLESFISTNELFKQLFPDGDSAQFVSFIMVIMALCGTIPVLQFILKVRSQEKYGFAEIILARSVSHYDLFSGYFLIAMVSSVLLPFLNAAGIWAGSYTVMDKPIPFSIFLQSSLVYIPAIWFMLGIAMLLIAYLPHFASLVWAYLGYTFLILYIGSMIKFPEWMAKLSPFGYTPKLPFEKFSITGIAILTLSAAVMFVLSFVGYRKRDMKFL